MVDHWESLGFTPEEIKEIKRKQAELGMRKLEDGERNPRPEKRSFRSVRHNV